jgi:hypothetical protein
MNDLTCFNPECKHVGLTLAKTEAPGHKAFRYKVLFSIQCPHCLCTGPAEDTKSIAERSYRRLHAQLTSQQVSHA